MHPVDDGLAQAYRGVQGVRVSPACVRRYSALGGEQLMKMITREPAEGRRSPRYGWNHVLRTRLRRWRCLDLATPHDPPPEASGAHQARPLAR
jgi:hypothetical protein